MYRSSGGYWSAMRFAHTQTGCCGLSSVVYHRWEGKCSEILATPSYSKNPRVNKDI